MACEYCTDPDGQPCFPIFGVGPHKCFWKIPGAVIGQSEPIQKEQWPDNYQETEPGMGIYWCPECGEGKP